MEKSRITSGLMADAVLGAPDDNSPQGTGYASYFDAMSAIEGHRVAIAKLIADEKFDALKAAADYVKGIAAQLRILALQGNSGISMISLSEVVGNAQRLGSKCAELGAMTNNNEKDCAQKHFDEMAALIDSLKRFSKQSL